jgi:hypothetical protein
MCGNVKTIIIRAIKIHKPLLPDGEKKKYSLKKLPDNVFV